MSTENILFDDIQIGMRYQRSHTVTPSDFALFAMLAGHEGEGDDARAPAIGVFPLMSSTTTNFFPGNGSLLEGHGMKSHGCRIPFRRTAGIPRPSIR